MIEKSGVEKDYIHGIGFDATCSLVVLDADGKPVSVSHGEYSPKHNFDCYISHLQELHTNPNLLVC